MPEKANACKNRKKFLEKHDWWYVNVKRWRKPHEIIWINIFLIAKIYQRHKLTYINV